MKSYFEGRTQAVSISKDGKEFLSQFRNIRIEIPQGGIAGPLFLLIYLNDIFAVVEKYQKGIIARYSDDKSMLIRQ